MGSPLSLKHLLMVRTFLKVYMELGSSFLFLQEQIKDIIITKTKRYSGSIIRFIGGISVIVIVSVTGDRAGEVFLDGHEEGGD
jgi:hypothetical protein